MPQLSIVVPFVSGETQLETTLLSILENRPRDAEIIVVHRGTYSDPYRLAPEEITIVEAGREQSLTGLINEGTKAACGPIVHILLPGVVVSEGWSRPAVQSFQDLEIAGCASHQICETASSIGIDVQSLPHHCVVQRLRHTSRITPQINGGFFRRRFLLALDGFLDCTLEGAEVEFGLAQQALGMRSIAMMESEVDSRLTESTNGTHRYGLGQITGQLAAAYSEIAGSQVNVETLATRLGHLAGGLMNPSTVAERLGWVIGTRDRSLVGLISDRIARAESQLASWRNNVTEKHVSLRRAA